MFEQSNDLTKGLNSDLNPLKQPENTYREAKNFVRLSDTGDYYSFINEKGTLEYCDLPDTYSVIGRIVLESDIIFISVKNDLSASQIGIVASNGTYTVMLDDTNNELNLDLDYPIDLEARVLINSNRVIYFVDNKNVPRTIDLDNPPIIGKIDKLSSLVPVSDFPVIDTFEVRDSVTTLKCGAYQFLFRYLDSKGNITNISIPSSPVSIGQNSVSSENRYQGGYPGVSAEKSIVLNISNIDTDYKKLEVIVVNYTTTDNIISIHSAAQIDIDSTTEIYEYKGESLYELTIEEIQGLTTNYSTAKCIAQKDGRLIISNLKENATIESQLQTIANNITLKYSIETVDVNAYKDGDNTAHKVGYKRGEVYAFGFGVIYKNGAKSLVYHIPAPYVNGTNGTITNLANTGTKILGTYLSTLTYPTGQNYPSNANNGILYHVMPTYAQEPPYGTVSGSYPTLKSTVQGSGNNIINILKVNPEFTNIAAWNGIKDQIQGIFIVRRRRDKVANMSIFSQGIANYMIDEFKINQVGNEDETSTITETNDYKVYDNKTKILKKSPFLGGIRLGDYMPYDDGAGYIWDGIVDGSDGLQTTSQPLQQSFVDDSSTYPNQTSINGTPSTTLVTTGPGSTTIGQLYKDLLVFYSPEAQLLPRLEANTFTKIKRIATTIFTDNPVRFNGSQFDEEDPTAGGASHLKLYPMYFNAFKQATIDTTLYSNTTLNISKNFYVPRNSTVTTNYDVDIDNTKQESFLFLQTKEDNSFADDERTFKYIASRNNTSANDYVSTNDITKNIYEVVSENTSQYGSVQGQEYVICKYIPYDQVTLPNLSTYNGTDVYGGDTYITRMSFTNKCPIQSKYFHKGTTSKWFDPTFSNDNSFGKEYIDLRSNIEFYVESTKNTDLRHSIDGGNLYYRYTDLDTALITSPEFAGDTNSYNNQYDFENTIQLFYSKSDISSTGNNHFKTRSIWSDETISGELRDRYRDIHPNDFYDIPFNTGEIWDSIVYNNTLFLHTPKTLWRTYFNSIENQVSTAGQVVLGTGGVFPPNLPPQQVITQQGGYAGTISQWAGCNTPFGYVFPDSLQGKIFILSNGKDGAALEEISMNGIIRYTNDNLSVLADKYTTYNDNPFKSGDYGLLSVYDFELKRWILVKQHPTNSLTISYDPTTKQFISNHDYKPNVLISRDNRLFGIMNSETDIKLYEHNKGNYGDFYGTTYSSSISIVVNTGATVQKVFDNLILSANSESSTKIQGYRGNGDTIEVYNERQHSGVTNIIWNNDYGYLRARDEVRGQLLRDGYNFKIPLNSLISDNNPIFDTDGNLITSNINQDKLNRDRIKGYYCVIKYTFSNDDNYKLVLNEIKTKFREYSR